MKKILEENKKYLILLVVVILLMLGYATFKNVKEYKLSHKSLNVNQDDILTTYANLNYDENEYTVVDIEENTLMLNYYKDFINMIVNDPDKSWDYLIDETKEKYGTIENYKKYLKEEVITVNTLSNSIAKYDVIDINDSYKQIIIADTDNYYYVFYVKGIWNYTVKIIGKD